MGDDGRFGRVLITFHPLYVSSPHRQCYNLFSTYLPNLATNDPLAVPFTHVASVPLIAAQFAETCSVGLHCKGTTHTRHSDSWAVVTIPA